MGRTIAWVLSLLLLLLTASSESTTPDRMGEAERRCSTRSLPSVFLYGILGPSLHSV